MPDTTTAPATTTATDFDILPALTDGEDVNWCDVYVLASGIAHPRRRRPKQLQPGRRMLTLPSWTAAPQFAIIANMNSAVRRATVETIVSNDAESATILSLVEALEERGNTVEDQPAIIAGNRRYEIPDGLANVLVNVATALSSGQGVTVVPRHRLLTTQEAADILNISRPTLIKILNEGSIPYENRGSHRRIRLQNVLDYQESLRTRRSEALDRMQAQSHADGIYDALDTTLNRG